MSKAAISSWTAPMASTSMSTIAPSTATSSGCARSSRPSMASSRRSKRFMVSDIATATAEPKAPAAAPAEATAPPPRLARGLRRRRRLSPLTRRILAVNVLALGLLGLGLLYLGEYQQSLVSAQLDALKMQGEIFAAALGEGAVIDSLGEGEQLVP